MVYTRRYSNKQNKKSQIQWLRSTVDELLVQALKDVFTKIKMLYKWFWPKKIVYTLTFWGGIQ